MKKGNFKIRVHDKVLSLLQDKIDTLQKELKSVTKSGNEETKSSAGDKHEVGRAMMQLEQEKLAKQLSEAQKSAGLLYTIKPTDVMNEAGLGALVTTEKGVFYLAVSIGGVQVEEQNVFVISLASPIGQQLLSKIEGQSLDFNGVQQQILAIC